ncbi:type VII secretion target [Mycobacterium hubeiense]|uniref:type VII secretion target n=1 Tax=Mycobacterium hubeiense TaxID=1867256 RepID=UPI000C7EAC67|nr:type VII secretion target [Mycobacterium sp. QGD 101]
MDKDLRVTVDGLFALAGRCETLAGRLASTTPRANDGSAEQASAAAAVAARTRASAAGAALAAWTQATASTLTAAAGAYERTDTDSAADLGTTVT